MMSLIALIYLIHFIMLGNLTRFAFHWAKGTSLVWEVNIEWLAHSFFQGILLHVIMLNAWQLTGLDSTPLLWILAAAMCGGLVVLIRQWLVQRPKGVLTKPKPMHMVILALVWLLSLLLLWLGTSLPNLAWDSWIVWEGKARQWLQHGLAADIVNWDLWLSQDQAIFNPSAAYPDGLSLLHYVPMLLTNEAFAVMHVVVLFAYAMVVLLVVSRLAARSAPWYWQLLVVGIFYTTPMLNNHLVIHGYADLWIGMYVLMIMISLQDWLATEQTPQKPIGKGLTVVAYVVMLPMLKLEGWVWLLLFILALAWTQVSNSRQRWMVLLAVVMSVGLLLWMGIHWSTAWGDLVLSTQRIALFHLFDFSIQYVNITDALLNSLLWQNNWGLVWLGLPWLVLAHVNSNQTQAHRVAHVFLVMALLAFLFLFCFTPASQWALDMTAINRIVLQLTPCYLFLLCSLITTLLTTQTTRA
jgi:hypothetical protein